MPDDLAQQQAAILEAWNAARVELLAANEAYKEAVKEALRAKSSQEEQRIKSALARLHAAGERVGTCRSAEAQLAYLAGEEGRRPNPIRTRVVKAPNTDLAAGIDRDVAAGGVLPPEKDKRPAGPQPLVYDRKG